MTHNYTPNTGTEVTLIPKTAPSVVLNPVSFNIPDGMSAFGVWATAQEPKADGTPYTVAEYLADNKGKDGDGIHLKTTVDTRDDLPTAGNILGDVILVESTFEIAIFNSKGEWTFKSLAQFKGLSAYDVWVQQQNEGADTSMEAYLAYNEGTRIVSVEITTTRF